MRYVKSSLPRPSDGLQAKWVNIVVPDQSLTLKDILERFTRGEAMPIARDEQFGGNEDLDDPLNFDLEKLVKADMTERDEVAQKIKEMRVQAEREEKERGRKEAEHKAKAKAAAEEKRIADEVEKRTKGRTGPSQ